MANKLTRKQAKRMALKLHKEGYEYDDIAKELAKNGYSSSRTGKPLAKHSVYQLISRAKNDKSIRVRAKTGAATKEKEALKMEIVRLVLSVPGVDTDAKMALTEMILQL